MHLLCIPALALFFLVACNRAPADYAATGTFESTEITVSAEQPGRLLRLDLSEGDRIEAGREVGVVDTVQLYLKALQLGATKESFAYQRPDLSKQVAATRQQLVKAEQELKRAEALVNEGAAGTKQRDDAANAVEVIRKQLVAQTSVLSQTTQSLSSQMSAAEIQRRQVLDLLAKCRIASPVSGTVLEKYAEVGEYVVPGRPLFKVADVQRLFLRAYLTTAQLEKVKVGQRVEVQADFGNGNLLRRPGKVMWISATSEFTPKTILTDDERADLVYAVKVAVDNADGRIKIGMYGRLKF